jgi:hypothetical protein
LIFYKNKIAKKMSDLYRLVYTSFRNHKCDDLEISKILDACKRNNPQRGVTGILMHSDSRFIQYIEGGKSEILGLFELIKDDPRHTSVSQRNFEKIDARMFPSWEMGFKDISKESIAFNTEVSDQDKNIFEGLIKGELDFDNSGMRLLQLFFKMN